MHRTTCLVSLLLLVAPLARATDAPSIADVRTVHRSLAFELTATGHGLAHARRAVLAAADGSWETPLAITGGDDGTLTASAALAADVPGCVVRIEGADGAMATGAVLADPAPPPLAATGSGGCVRRFEEILDPADPYMIQPKDFAFVLGGWTAVGSWTYHLFYIRQNQRIAGRFGVDNTEKTLGHAVSNDLVDWPAAAIDTAAIKVRPGRFDSRHVWAPSIVRRGVTFYMFYTGVDDAGDQRIGLATSTDLVNWTQTDSILMADPTPGVGHVTWADPHPTPGTGPYNGQAQLRDPFVMPDPGIPGDWLMYFVTVASATTPQTVVGAARSHGDFTQWTSSFPMWNTAFPKPAAGSTSKVESPHVLFRHQRWWLFYTVNGDTVWAEQSANGPTDTLSAGARWSAAQKLTTLVPPAQAAWFYYWHASEYLQVSDIKDLEFLAGFDDAQPGIVYGRMLPATAPTLFEIDCNDLAAGVGGGPAPGGLRLLLLGAAPARAAASFRVELPASTRARVAIYDVTGRQVRTLADGVLPAGGTDLAWDGRDDAGARTGSGVYFASLVTADGRRSIRVPVIR